MTRFSKLRKGGKGRITVLINSTKINQESFPSSSSPLCMMANIRGFSSAYSTYTHHVHKAQKQAPTRRRLSPSLSFKKGSTLPVKPGKRQQQRRHRHHHTTVHDPPSSSWNETYPMSNGPLEKEGRRRKRKRERGDNPNPF